MSLTTDGTVETNATETLGVFIAGHELLENPVLNKGSAFSEVERRAFGLLGLLPFHPSTIEEQLARTYENYRRKETDLERYIFLVSLQDRNETLFYRLLQEHITEMMPIIYTPTVGLGCQRYSHVFRRPRGLYISYLQQGEIDLILENAPADDLAVIVVTDGERILGLGDLGVGGMGIPVGKLSLYTLCAGIHPARTLPILLDVGTNNQELLNDPLYLGWRHERLRGPQYDDFVEAFVQGVLRKFPNVLLQWEDFSKHNAPRLLERYRDRLCTFNDDIQGTGAVTLAGLLAATKMLNTKLGEQRIVILGAGSSAIGISDQIVAAMLSEGLSLAQARARIWLLDSQGLVHTGRTDLEREPQKQKYAQASEQLSEWKLVTPEHITLEDVVKHVHPSVLIGTSAQPGAFTEAVVRELAEHVARPIIFPLSNPTSKSEAVPSDLLAWTNGRALIATGSPFKEVVYQGQSFRFGQCNNAFIFPGVGLGVIASGARRVTDAMFVAAARVLSTFSPALHDPTAPLYPPLENVREVSRRVALAVGREAQRAGLAAETTLAELERRIAVRMWQPQYVQYQRQVA
ncbi:MAG: NAD-dependent malic enzyme [Acidobacteria bacterium]|nr:NAD-dependent malic enzyme [Acidobacteriota bacterium]MBI3427181.1 NAD-dependent malic enzyme [Acidobacteriota bacterium]